MTKNLIYTMSLAIFTLNSSATRAEFGLNFPPPATHIAHEVYDLHMMVFWICVGIAVVVFGAMFYSIIAHRKANGAQPAQFHHSTTVEIIWTLIPLIILVTMAIPATQTLLKMYDSSNSEMTVKITASQFKWQYEYLQEDIKFISALATPEDQIYAGAARGENYLLEVDNPVVLPTDTKIRFLFTAADVIHAWWVPALSVKKDAIPGFINQMWTKIDKPGIYRGQCAELCGAKHGFMPIVIHAKTPAEYQAWVAEKQAAQKAEQAALLAGKDMTLQELMARGEKVYAANCSVCHQSTGAGLPPTFPALKGSAMVTQQPVENQVKQILHGKNAMPAFANALNDIEIAAVTTYTKNSWDNNTGKLVQPKDVNALR